MRVTGIYYRLLHSLDVKRSHVCSTKLMESYIHVSAANV